MAAPGIDDVIELKAKLGRKIILFTPKIDDTRPTVSVDGPGEIVWLEHEFTETGPEIDDHLGARWVFVGMGWPAVGTYRVKFADDGDVFTTYVVDVYDPNATSEED